MKKARHTVRCAPPTVFGGEGFFLHLTDCSQSVNVCAPAPRVSANINNQNKSTPPKRCAFYMYRKLYSSIANVLPVGAYFVYFMPTMSNIFFEATTLSEPAYLSSP